MVSTPLSAGPLHSLAWVPHSRSKRPAWLPAGTAWGRMVLCDVPTTWKRAWLGDRRSMGPWYVSSGREAVAVCFRVGQGRRSLDGNVAEGTEGKEKTFLEWGHTSPRAQWTPCLPGVPQTPPGTTLLAGRAKSFSTALGTGRGSSWCPFLSRTVGEHLHHYQVSPRRQCHPG